MEVASCEIFRGIILNIYMRSDNPRNRKEALVPDEIARKLYPNDEGKQKAWMKIHRKRLLDRGKIEKLVGALGSIESDNPEVTENSHRGRLFRAKCRAPAILQVSRPSPICWFRRH